LRQRSDAQAIDDPLGLRLKGNPMRSFFDLRQRLHAPVSELHNGAFVPYAEHGGRVDSMLAALGAVEPAADHGEGPLLRVHHPDYLAFLRSAHDKWRAAGRPGDAFAYVWPIAGRRKLALDRIDAKLGLYSYDSASPIAAGTWESAYWSAQTALTALEAVLAGERAAFALCRPPGHHAGADYLGGYCHINSAAVVAQAARDRGCERVAILDVDYHHGNGTQDIFYARGDVLFASIHADPRTDYPFFWGHADEKGEGEGEGATLNLPLPRGTAIDTYERALATALEAIARFGPDLLVVSYGADTYEHDPISQFRLRTADYTRLASRIASLCVPSVVVMEGGYAVDALGSNVCAFLQGF
jgi:acetoin utilization deacetylase AcuC-like enzyme